MAMINKKGYNNMYEIKKNKISIKPKKGFSTNIKKKL